jgi:hypothetical protein
MGRVIPLPENCKFVEVCDLDGNLGQVVYSDTQGFIRILGPGEPESERYAKLFGLKWSRVIKLPDVSNPSMSHS